MVLPAYRRTSAAATATEANPVEQFPTISHLVPFAGPGLLPGSRPGPDVPSMPTSPVQTNPSQVPQAQTIAFPSVLRIIDAHHYANVIETNFPVPVSTGQSTKVVEAAPNVRNFLMIRNTDSVSNVLVSFGRAANPTSALSLAPGQLVVFDQVVPQGDIYVLSAGAAATVSISYSNL